MKVNNMKIKMKQFQKVSFGIALLAILLSFNSCSNLFSEKLVQREDNNTYLMLSSGDVAINSRTANPSTEYALNNLTSVYLYAKQVEDKEGNAVSKTEKTLAGSNSLTLADLYKKQLPLTDGAGIYTIRMSAKLDSICFYKKLENVVIEENKTNSIPIELEPVKDSNNLETPFEEYGGFSFTINADVGSANQDIDSIYVTLQNLGTNKIVDQRYINRSTNTPKLSSKTVYEHLADKSEDLLNGRVPVGTYRLTLDFLALDKSIGQDILVNSYPFIINVIKGQNTHFEETLDLTPVHSITYSNYSGATPAPGERMRTKFTSKNEVILPRMVKDGYTFNGWYKTSNYSGEACEKVEIGTLENQRFYAKFTASKLYVDATTGDNTKDGSTSSKAIKTLSRAVEIINEANDSSCEWYIYMSGEFTEPQTIAGNYQDDYREPILAKSINIVGNDAVIYSSASSAALTILTDTPVTIKDIEIDSNSVGEYGIYMGYDDEHSSSIDSKLTLGSGVNVHGSTVHDVYAHNGKLYLYGSVVINELYAEGECDIVLLDELASSASITITPCYYSEPTISEIYVNKTELISYDKTLINFANNYNYFHVTPEGNEIEWFIDEEGCLNKVCKITFSGDGTGAMSELSVGELSPIWQDDNTFQITPREGYEFMGWYYVYEKTHYDGHNDIHDGYVMKPFEFKDSADDYDFTHIYSDMTVYATWRYLGSSSIYVNADIGADSAYVDRDDETEIYLGDGSETKPLRSVGAALELIKLINNPTEDYTITISGKTDDYNLDIDNNLPVNSLVLQGKTSAKTDGINCDGYNLPEFVSVLKVSTSVPVTIKNMLVQGRLGEYEVDGAIMNIGNGSTVTLENGTVFDAAYSSIVTKGAVAIEDGGTLIMEDGVTFHNFDVKGGAVNVKTGGTFIMNGGTFEDNSSDGTCGAVYVNGGTFTMNNGYIKNNWQDAFQRTYLLPQGAGVCVASGTFIMEGGHIINNESYVSNVNEYYTTAGGGVFVYANGTFIMHGGEITGNHAYNKAKYSNGTTSDDSTAHSYGGGVCLQASGNKIASFTMTGGTISGNTAGTSGNGIGFYGTPSEGTTGVITIGGTAVINADNDIYLPDFVTIAVESELTNITAENKVVITPKTYSPSVQALVVAENADKALMSEFSKFTVTTDGSQEWSLSEQGKLQTFVDVSSICNQITSMTSSGTVTIVGEMTVDDVPQITAALKTLYENNPSINVTLDMSDVYGFTEFPDKAFYDSTSYRGPDNFVGISLPKSLTAIGVRAFWSCTHLSSVIIPEGVITISQQAFESCEGLESITIPETVTYLDTQAFASSGLKSINLPKNLEGIGELTFGSAPLSTITVAEDNSYFSAEDGVLYNADKTQLVLYPIGKEDKSFSIPSSVTSIAGAAFLGSQLETISIPDTVSAIGNQAFQSCSKLKSLTLPSALTIINPQILDRCSLTSLVIPDNVTKIMGSAFRYSTSLKSITLPASLISIANGAFDSCTALEKVFYKGTESQKDSIDIQDYKIKSSDVTWVYNFGNIGSKSAPSAVGDIVFYDGTAISYSDTLTLTNEQKDAAIAVIVYKGTECSDNGTTRMLGVGLVQERGATLTWCTSDANAADTEINSIECSASGDGPDAVYSGDLNGSDNFTQIADILKNNNDTDNETKYPVFYWAKNYATYATNLSGTAFEDGWYIPSIAELLQVRNSCVDTEETGAPGNGNELYKALELCGGHTIQKTRAAGLPNGDAAGGNYYFSSSQHINSESAFIMDFYDASWNSQEKTVNGMGEDGETNVFTLVIREF